MRQVWITRHGGPQVLQLREAPDPEPNAGEVRVRVHASGVNFADILIRIGIYPHAPKLPAVIGYEVSGVIDALGDGVKGLSAGKRVLAFTPRYGGYSEVINVPANEVLAIPERLSFEQAAAIPVNYLTAWIMLIRLGNLQQGERVLIHAAAGGVGQAALQMCRWRGARVIGTASAIKHARLKQLGVEHSIDYRTQDFEAEVMRLTDGKGVDVVLDAVGGKSFAKSYRCLAPLGRLCVFGASGMVRGKRRNLLHVLKEWIAMPRFSPLALLQENRGVFGMTLGSLKREVATRRQMLEQILELVHEGQLDPVVDRAFSFDEAAEAHHYIQARRNFGKVLLRP